MQYELYIDVFFLVNFMMDYLVLLIVKKALSCTATHGRICMGALTGSFGICLVIILPIPSFMKIICLHTLINTLLVVIGLQAYKKHIFWKAFFLVYVTSFLMGGIMEWLAQYTGGYFRLGSLFFSALVGTYSLVSAIATFLQKIWKLNNFYCEAMLYMGDTSLRVKAIIDSGNRLIDTMTGKPVHIVDRKVAEKLTEKEAIQKIRYLSYRTVQEREGVLPVITIDKLRIYGEKEKEVEFPLIGISGQYEFSDGDYEIILHPDSC